jgi:hypothetical protein
MVGEGSGKEPNGWELLRGLERVESAVTSALAGMVPMALFLALQKRVEDLEEAEKERQRSQARMWAGVALAFVTAVIGIVATLSLRGLGVAP